MMNIKYIKNIKLYLSLVFLGIALGCSPRDKQKTATGKEGDSFSGGVLSGLENSTSIQTVSNLLACLEGHNLTIVDVKGGDPNDTEFTKPTGRIIMITESGKLYARKKDESVFDMLELKSAFLRCGDILLDVINDGHIRNSYGNVENNWSLGSLLEGKDGMLCFIRKNRNGKPISALTLIVEGQMFKIGNEKTERMVAQESEQQLND